MYVILNLAYPLRDNPEKSFDNILNLLVPPTPQKSKENLSTPLLFLALSQSAKCCDNSVTENIKCSDDIFKWGGKVGLLICQGLLLVLPGQAEEGGGEGDRNHGLP